jgi:NAD(P)H-hydrate epimerase
MVIDADAINVMTPEIIRERKAPSVITPHPGEFARLTGKTTGEIGKNRVDCALKLSRECDVTVVLKGAGTVIANPVGEYYINTSGHSCLAVAGSGDVLAGIAGSLIGQGISVEKAAPLAVYIHGKCGEALASGKDLSGFTAGEICSRVPEVMAELRQCKIEGRNTFEYDV